MPPNPWKLLKTAELTAQQKRELNTKLLKRHKNLKDALDNLEEAIKVVSKSLDQQGNSKYTVDRQGNRIKRKKIGR
jgi:hypothetical protein